MKPTLVILAAGMASRYGSMKQVESFGPAGETIMDYSIYDAIRAGFGKVVFIIRAQHGETFRSIFEPKLADRIQTEYVYQELDLHTGGYAWLPTRTKPWGTAHAVLCAQGVVQEPFAVINADDFYGRDSYAKLGHYLAALSNESTAYAMVGFTLKNTLSEHGTVARGVCQTDAVGNLTDIQELTKIAKLTHGAEHRGDDGKVVALSGEEPVSMNMWGFTPAIFPQLEADFRAFLAAKGAEMKSEAYIPMSVGSIIRNSQATCQVLRSDSTWFGVTYREDKPVVQASIAQQVSSGAYPPSLWA